MGQKGTNVLGAKTAMELRGIPCIDLQVDQEKKKKLLCFKIIW